MYWNDEKIDMSLIYTKCNKNALVSLRVYGDNKHFPKNSSFFHNFKRMTLMSKVTKLYS
jgi:hypothetical protein